MEDGFKSKFGFCLFIIFIIFLIVGGYFFTKKMINSDFTFNNKDNDRVINYKIDENKDYIYFINENTISKEANLVYKDVVINIKGEEKLTESLEAENKANKESVMYISKQGLPNLDGVYNYDDIYALFQRNYEVFDFGGYVSLVIKDYSYSCFDLLTFKSSKSYVYDTLEGKRLSENDLLSKYNITLEEIKNKIREELNNSQIIEDGVEIIKIDETLNNFQNYSLYINDFGKLCITYLVKSMDKDYNLNMEV